MLTRLAIRMRGAAAIMVPTQQDQNGNLIADRYRGCVRGDAEDRNEQGKQAGNHGQAAEDACASALRCPISVLHPANLSQSPHE
jgi:hypothetical protein